MNWEINCSNKKVENAFKDYRELITKISTLYAANRLFQSFNFDETNRNTAIPVSRDFDQACTTTHTVQDLETSISTGDFAQLTSSLGIIQLCTAFEIFLNTVAKAYNISVSGSDQFCIKHHCIPDGEMKVGNRSLKIIRKIHNQMSIDSRLNDDEVLAKLVSIIEVRNCLIHADGMIQSVNSSDRLKHYRMTFDVGEKLVLEPNVFDNILHYMLIHIRAFTNEAV